MRIQKHLYMFVYVDMPCKMRSQANSRSSGLKRFASYHSERTWLFAMAQREI